MAPGRQDGKTHHPERVRAALLRFLADAIRASVGDDEVAAGRHGVHQAGRDRVRVIGVWQRVQDREHGPILASARQPA
jgi:hypothetical protein